VLAVEARRLFGIPLKFCGDIWRRVRKEVGHAGRIKSVRNIW
jgi:hypothetical protein